MPRPSSRRRCDPDADPGREPEPDDDWPPSEAVSFRGRAPEEPEGLEELVELGGPEAELEELEGLEEEAALPSARCPAAGASSVGVISFFSLRSSARWSAAPTEKVVGAAFKSRFRAAAGQAGWSAGAG